MSDLSTVFEEISRGEHDSQIDALYVILRDRRNAIKEIEKINLFAALKVGDKVRMNSEVRPKYLRGKVGTVTAKRRTKVTVDLGQHYGRFGRTLICPVTLLEKV